MNNPWILLNNQLMNRNDGTVDIEKDKEAAKQFFLGYVNKNMVWFHSLNEKIDYLIENAYYFNMYEYYTYEEIKTVFSYVYEKKFRFSSYMAAFLFYKNYAMKDVEGDKFLERYEDRISTVALFTSINLKSGMGDIEAALRQADIMINQEYQPATPTFSNAGKLKSGMMTSCFLSEISDSKVGISKAIQASLDLSSMGGGVSFNLSKLRGRGEAIKGVKGRASGVLPVMKLLEDAFSYADQLGQRQGAGATYLNIFHSDIEEFLDSKKVNADEKVRIKSLSLGLIIPSKFMQLAEKDEPYYVFAAYSVYKEYGVYLDDMDMNEMYTQLLTNPNVTKIKLNARKMLGKIAQVQKESGYPYVFLKDNANEYHPLKNLGDVKFSNLCFSGDTKVLLGSGHVRTISDLAVYSKGEVKFSVYCSTFVNGKWEHEEQKAVAFQTGYKTTVNVLCSDGSSFRCTPDHKMALRDGRYIEVKDSVGYEIVSLTDGRILRVIEITPGEMEPVYDLTVDVNHNFFIVTKNTDNEDEFLLTHNCTEISQYSKVSEYNDYDKSDQDVINYGISCNLGSLNIEKVMNNSKKEPGRFAHIINTAMDSLTFVTDSTNIGAVPDIAKANRDFRSVGLGSMNLHGYLAQNFIMYESTEALDFCNVFFSMMNYHTLRRSMEISRDRGRDTFVGYEGSEYDNGKYFDRYLNDFNLFPRTERIKELFEGIEIPTFEDWKLLKEEIKINGLFHSYRLCVAPNQSTGYIMSATPSIMPISDQVEVREYGHSTTYYPMPGMNEDNMFYYKSAYDMDQFKVLRLVSVIQRHIDQGISCILHTNSADDTALLGRYYIYAWKMGLKSLYYTRTRKSSITECLTCSA